MARDDSDRNWLASFGWAAVGMVILWLKVAGWPGHVILPVVYLAISLTLDARRHVVTSRRMALHLLVAVAIGVAFRYIPAPPM